MNILMISMIYVSIHCIHSRMYVYMYITMKKPHSWQALESWWMASDLRLGSEDVSKEKSIMGMDSSGSEAIWSSCSLRLRTVEEEEHLQGIDDSSSDLTLAGFGTGTRLLTEASIL